MPLPTDKPTGVGRRRFLRNSLAAGAAAVVVVRAGAARGGANGPALQAGEGVVDITPPLGVELAGFHSADGRTRNVSAVRQPAALRALALRVGDAAAAVVSADIPIFSTEVTARVQARVAKEHGIPAEHVRLCATHTHSMPSLAFLRQWGAMSPQYTRLVEDAAVKAVGLAKDDLAAAELYAGAGASEGANFNRTVGKWKTDAEFSDAASDDERWLDTAVHVLRFERAAPKGALLWYHFSAHPVCYNDTQAGPDWPGLVDGLVREGEKVGPSFLQGHAGDVNPGNGNPWRGDPEHTAKQVHAAIRKALDGAARVKVDGLRIVRADCKLPLDHERLKRELERYRADPAACTSGEWVDAGFAKDWFASASKYDPNRTHFPAPVTAMRLGEVGWLFHPSELFSFYGLSIRRRSPLPRTLVVGYADGIVGYLPDPNAFAAGAYEAVVVPKILDIPPFTPTAGREFTEEVVKLAKECFG